MHAYPAIYLFIHIYISICLPACLSVCLSISQSNYLSICTYTHAHTYTHERVFVILCIYALSPSLQTHQESFWASPRVAGLLDLGSASGESYLVRALGGAHEIVETVAHSRFCTVLEAVGSVSSVSPETGRSGPSGGSLIQNCTLFVQMNSRVCTQIGACRHGNAWCF